MPWWDRTTKENANQQERNLASSLGARLTPNSGATALSKGDMRLGKSLIESKATEKASMSVKREWLEKIEQEALERGLVPVLILEFGDRRWMVIRENDLIVEEE